LQIEVALRVELDPTVKRRTLQGDEFFEQAIHGASSALSGYRGNEDVGAILKDRLVWQPDPAMPPVTIELDPFFDDVTGEG
jgi:hypothetical protein